MSALITGYLDDSWLRAVRRWTMFAWLFLSIGLGLGMIWAYEELGWGGYWMWDPVENAGLLPWFTATAFLHSVMVQERRGMLKVWNVALVILTFFLTIFQTFMTRSGIVQSVHAFGQDAALARMFTAFMIALLVFSFGWLIYRLPLLRARNELDSWVSREAAFLLNNWILVFSAFFVLFGTMFPTISEAVRGERLTVGAVFFNQWMLPIGLVLLLLTGIGPLLAWRKSTLVNLRDQFLFPVGLGLAVATGVVLGGVRVWTSGICFALSGMVFGTIAQEFWRGARVRQITTGTDLFTALVGLVGRNKRRYGGYIVHLGIVLLCLGFAGEGFKKKVEARLTPGQQVQLGNFVVRQDALTVTQDDAKQMITANITVERDGALFAKMYPAKWFFNKHEDQPTTEVAIQRGFAQDLYLVLSTFDVATQTADLEVHLNPLVNWIWTGFGLIALGTFIALLPDTAFAFAITAVPEAAATTTVMLLVLVLGQTALMAQGDTPAGKATTGQVIGHSALENSLKKEIMCTCGGCRLSVHDCGMMNCHGKASQTTKLQKLIAEGKSREEIVAIFVKDNGSEDILMRPIDRGFNRLAWLFPYVAAVAGLIAIAYTARRWSSHPGSRALAGDAGLDPTLNARLDDELRNLD
jgi:cytochrome c-type biogenesis protein CcmF